MGKFSRITISLAFTTLSLLCLVVVLVSGLKNRSGKLDQLSFAVIDSSKVEAKIKGHTYRGLPDANDFSKYKDFYAFYLWNYCSGQIRSGNYYVDFCSKPQQSLYDLFGFWKVWGASVHKEGTRFYWLEKGPKLLYVSYVVAASLNAFEFLIGIPSLFTKRVSKVTVVLSAAAAICLLTTSILTQVTYGQLISRANDDDTPFLARRVGVLLYVANWLGSICSLIALSSWYHTLNSTPIKRTATIDTTKYSHPQATGVDSPILARSLETPVRKRTFSRWPNN